MKKIISRILSTVIAAALALTLMPKGVVHAETAYEMNKWTIFCYFCGSNLEDDYSASDDIEEMIESTSGTDLRYVVMCGGSNVDHDYFKHWATYRILIEDGKVYKVGNPALLDMGDAGTLSDFLQWGLSEFPSEHSGLVIWDHGAGAIGGCCYDDLFDFDNLTLPEMSQAFDKAANVSDRKFDFVAYDCCEMAALELACILEDHADYFAASQEVMPAEGFDYTSITDYIVSNPDCDGFAACEALANGYWDSLGSPIPYYGTISIMDLSKLDTLMTTLGRYLSSVDTYIENDSSARSALQSALRSESSLDDCNMVDLNDLIDCCSVYSDPASFALNEAVVDFIPYVRNSNEHAGFSGVTVYVPVNRPYPDELEIFEEIVPDVPGYEDFIYDLTGC